MSDYQTIIKEDWTRDLMKHTVKVTLLLVAIFVFAQMIGILITNQYIDYDATVSSGNATFKALPGGIERPEVEESSSFFWIMGAILFGTILVLVLIRMKKMRVWKMWFLLSVILCLTVGLGSFLPGLLAFLLAVLLGIWKIYRPNIWMHNLTELFIYGGLAAIFVSMVNLFSAFILLVLISAYDMYAVWKSKHMITLANAQSTNKLFAGLMLPYEKKKGKTRIDVNSSMPSSVKKAKTKKVRSAILGGGDIGFPLIFTTVVFKTLVMTGTTRPVSFIYSLIITFFTALALSWLLFKGEKDRFYPAMPFLSLGCLVGFIVIAMMRPEVLSALIEQTLGAISGLF